MAATWSAPYWEPVCFAWLRMSGDRRVICSSKVGVVLQSCLAKQLNHCHIEGYQAGNPRTADNSAKPITSSLWPPACAPFRRT